MNHSGADWKRVARQLLFAGQKQKKVGGLNALFCFLRRTANDEEHRRVLISQTTQQQQQQQQQQQNLLFSAHHRPSPPPPCPGGGAGGREVSGQTWKIKDGQHQQHRQHLINTWY